MKLEFNAQRPLDVICLGRAGVDLHAQLADTSLAGTPGFNKFVGGSPANIATALAKLKRKAGFIGCLSDDGLGNYVYDYLNEQGVDLQGMQWDDSGTRTSLAVTEMRPNSPEVVIYRNNAADLALHPAAVDAGYIAKASFLLVSGTALCMSPSRDATLLAMHYARARGTRVVLDIDYREYSWDSTEAAALYYTLAAGMADILIGNREEFDVLESLNAPAERDDAATAKHYLNAVTEVVIIKDGPEGCRAFCRDGEQYSQGIFPVTARKPFGAGDAFAGALLAALLHGHTIDEAMGVGAAAAAINVSGDSCTESMPDLPQLNSFLAERCRPELRLQ